MTDKHQVVIIGGGFGGLTAAKAFRNADDVEITLVDRRNFHLFQPLLYQVATGGLSPANIAAPLRSIFRHRRNVRTVLGEVTDIDVANKQVILADTGSTLPYDTLIIATGAQHHYFGHNEWENLAPGLKTIEDATEIRRRILYAFEAAERETDPQKVREWLTFVVVGGGPTGVEMAGTVGEIAHYTLRNEFRSIDPASARVILIEGTDRVLPTFAPDLSRNAAWQLQKLGVEVLTQALVTDVQPFLVTYKQNDRTQQIATRSIIWSAGVQASPLGKLVAESTGASIDRSGRVIVQPDMSLAGHPELFVIGDLANYSHQDGKPLPGVAQVAMQQGRFVARNLLRKLRGESTEAQFVYRDLGTMATIGRAAAVAQIGKIHLTGFIGWLGWLFIHLMYIVEFQNRVLILLQWAWNYVTRNRAARLITGRSLPTLATITRAEAEKVPVAESLH
ncbi:MAG: NAD(P)/FAD-dependent oxidoreductase [Anaerolineae bacterium]|nr:NAD(P)/FAD-dependent oxidoreductase [Anaerolineae bacterium]